MAQVLLEEYDTDHKTTTGDGSGSNNGDGTNQNRDRTEDYLSIERLNLILLNARTITSPTSPLAKATTANELDDSKLVLNGEIKKYALPDNFSVKRLGKRGLENELELDEVAVQQQATQRFKSENEDQINTVEQRSRDSEAREILIEKEVPGRSL